MRLRFLCLPGLLILMLTFIVSCNSNEDKGRTSGDDLQDRLDIQDTEGHGEFSFEFLAHNFGEVQAGEKVTKRFTFVNTGSAPLVIHNAQASCGCTVPDYTSEPVEPGGTGYVDVEYNSKGRAPQTFNQNVTLYANTESRRETLTISGEIVEEKSGNDRTSDIQDRMRSQLEQQFGKNNNAHDHSGEQETDFHPDLPRFEFEKTEHDFGEITKGDVVSEKFYFTNAGREPIIIKETSSKCGCTIPEHPEKPIQHGERSYIKVSYDTNVRQVTKFHQVVEIEANTFPVRNFLQITGTVSE